MQGLLGMTIQGEFGSFICLFILFLTLLLAFSHRLYLLQFSMHLLFSYFFSKLIHSVLTIIISSLPFVSLESILSGNGIVKVSY